MLFLCYHQSTEWLSRFLSRAVFLRICCSHWKPLQCMARSLKILDFLSKFGFGKDRKRQGGTETQYSLPGHTPWPTLCQLVLYLLLAAQQADSIGVFWRHWVASCCLLMQWFEFSLPSLDDTHKTGETFFSYPLVCEAQKVSRAGSFTKWDWGKRVIEHNKKCAK